MKKFALIAMLLTLAACEDYKMPGFSKDPASMSEDTLCYRAAYAKKDTAVNDEIAARHLDCDKVLETQTMPGSGTGY